MTEIRVPPLGDSVTEATVARWAKSEGEAVAAGETIVELETDKINVEVPAQRAGILTRRVRAEGDVVGVNDVLGQMDEAVGTDTAAAPLTAPAGPTAPAQPHPRAESPPTGGRAPSQGEAGAHQRVAPSAARLAADLGVPLANVAGTGRGGVISKPDVVEHIRAAGQPAPPPPSPSAVPGRPEAAPPVSSPSGPATGGAATRATDTRETREKMSTRRKRIAENLLQSQLNTAHLTTFNEIDMSAVMAVRERHKERVEKEHGVKLSFMPFFAKASVMALQAYPVVNAQIDGDTIVYKHYVNLGIAVASEQGLVVPNIKDAHTKGILGLSRDIVALAKKARDTKLTMDDLTGGTFTVTNGGIFGSLVSTPIINYPQVGILGLHKIQERPVVLNGAIVARPMMYVALSYDHRIIDGQQAVLFLVRVKELMEDPAAMLIE